MANNDAPYRILVGTDFSALASQALDEALVLAAHRAPAELHLAAVIDSDHAEVLSPEDRKRSFIQIADHMHDRLTAAGNQALGRFRAAHPDLPLTTVAHVRFGHIAEQLVALAADVPADLIVIGTHGRRGVRRLLLGSVAEQTVRLAPCPVLVVRPLDRSALEHLPALEPACPACLRIRESSAGARWWCDAHESQPDEPHIYARSRRLDQPPPSIYSPGS